jgi:hypothetical protein
MSTNLRPLAALAMVAMIGAGCSNGAAENGNIGTSSSGGNTNADYENAAKFAECMRDNGVSEFPDPDASGGLTIDGIVNGSSLDPGTPAWKKAIGACKDLQPSGFMGHKRSAEEQEAALKFAQCMRDNGVEDFPDPSADGPLINVNGARSIPGFQAAMQKCRDVMAGALEGR